MTDIDSIFKEKEIDFNKVPYLYHYTTSKGLAGILKSKKIWATHYKFLNDSSELKVTFDIFKEEIKNKTEINVEAILNKIKITAFITSFCKTGDCYPQWIQYSKDGAGYCIEFDTKEMEDAKKIKPLPLLSEINYNLSKTKDMICRAIDFCWENEKMESLYKEKNNIDRFIDILSNLLTTIIVDSPTNKSEKFESEIEARLIYYFFSNQIPKNIEIKYRDLIPYIEHNISSNSIKSIYIGPTNDFEERKDQIIAFLESIDFPNKEIQIKKSQVPYRNTK